MRHRIVFVRAVKVDLMTSRGRADTATITKGRRCKCNVRCHVMVRMGGVAVEVADIEDTAGQVLLNVPCRFFRFLDSDE